VNCDRRPRRRALLIANALMSAEVERLQAGVSAGYVRRR
jgi:hypothetical protein